jgi:mRNA interferase MazF
MSPNSVGRLPLSIVVPITDWKPIYASYVWFVELEPTSQNKLIKHSGADAFQVKSLSQDRFVSYLGEITAAQLDEIAEAIALCVGLP